MLGYVLLIANEAKTSDTLCSMLDETGWVVFPARKTEDGLALLTRGWVPDVIVMQTDGERGLDREAAERLRTLCPSPLFFMSLDDSAKNPFGS